MENELNPFNVAAAACCAERILARYPDLSAVKLPFFVYYVLYIEMCDVSIRKKYNQELFFFSLVGSTIIKRQKLMIEIFYGISALFVSRKGTVRDGKIIFSCPSGRRKGPEFTALSSTSFDKIIAAAGRLTDSYFLLGVYQNV